MKMSEQLFDFRKTKKGDDIVMPSPIVFVFVNVKVNVNVNYLPKYLLYRPRKPCP